MHLLNVHYVIINPVRFRICYKYFQAKQRLIIIIHFADKVTANEITTMFITMTIRKHMNITLTFNQ